MNLDIKLDSHQNKFYTLVGPHECVLYFRQIKKGVLEYYRTFVPAELRGQGIAAQLTEYALKYAEEHRQKVLPTCSYTSSYINNHPEWSILVEK